MLLRRISEHIKAQNWFAVLIDFVIVVIGVYTASPLNPGRRIGRRRNTPRW